MLTQRTSAKNGRFIRSSAFTLVELLVVIGVVALLAVTLIALLNPAEAQKRNRDAKRIKDANVMQSVVNQFLEDGNSFGTACTTIIPCTSELVPAGSSFVTCDRVSANWLGGDDATASLCDYIQSIPVDPVNAVTDVVDDDQPGDTKEGLAVYRVAVSDRNYEIQVRQESVANKDKVIGDAGNSSEWVEISNTQDMTLD